MRKLTTLVVTMLLLGVLAPAGTAVGPEIVQRGMEAKRTWIGEVLGRKPGTISNLECTVENTTGAVNLNLDCDDPFPNNEPDIEVDPADPLHMVASSNDYGSCCDQFYTTFDGGKTWDTGNMSNEGPTRIGSDPVTVFDTKHDTVIHSSLNFTASGNQACDGDLVVSLSTDGGLVWRPPVLVADGVGCDPSATQLFHDKEWIVTDNNLDSPFYGRTYLTWSAFLAAKGNYLSSAIWEAHSDDGGRTWTAPKAISGRNAALCTFQEAGPDDGSCDENQFSVPTVGPDGTVYVAFENEQNEALWEPGEQFDDQYLVVKSTNGGGTWSPPRFVVGLEDGSTDYPLNVDDRQTLTGYQARVNSAGNIVADPTTNGRLYLVFADNRAGTHDAVVPVTNTNVFLMTSTNGGTSWSGPSVVDGRASDQWFPWVDVNPATGAVGVMYHGRVAANPDLYHTFYVVRSSGSSTRIRLSTAPSHPTDSIFFQAGVEGCEECATFIGDYNNVSFGTDGKANVAWTDMRDFDATEDGYRQWIYFRRV
jgi:hypothetical protein